MSPRRTSPNVVKCKSLLNIKYELFHVISNVQNVQRDTNVLWSQVWNVTPWHHWHMVIGRSLETIMIREYTLTTVTINHHQKDQKAEISYKAT